jgi:hypothetical protein
MICHILISSYGVIVGGGLEGHGVASSVLLGLGMGERVAISIVSGRNMR